jgi:hypothetical protein
MAYSLSDAESILSKAVSDLDKEWLGTATKWQDKAREDFNKEHLEDLHMAADNARQAMKRIDHLLRQVMRDCG